MHTSSSQDSSLSRKISFLKHVPLFANLGEQDLAALVDDFYRREYDKNEVVFHQGDHDRELYVVAKGKVRIFRTSPSGEETSIQVFSIHDVVGEFATIDSQPRSATARAITRCTLLRMRQDRFLHHFRQMPELALNVTQMLTTKLRWTAAYAETIAQYDTAGRLLHILLLYNEQFGEQIETDGLKDRCVLDLSLTQARLASLVGARREWVNRILRGWRKRGLIEYDGGRITILDLAAVERERDSRIEAFRDEGEW
jgi:CRP-like cAMP-binding protein